MKVPKHVSTTAIVTWVTRSVVMRVLLALVLLVGIGSLLCCFW